MSEPTVPAPEESVTDDLVEQTSNGLRPDDPDEQPPQDPAWVPDGSATATS